MINRFGIVRNLFCFSNQLEFLNQMEFPKRKETYVPQKLRSVDNTNRNLAFAFYLPKEWNETQIKQGLDPKGKYIEAVKVIKDELSNPTGKAMLSLKDEQAVEIITKKFREGMVDTEDVLQKIAVKSFGLKVNANKPEIQRKQKQAYVTGLPRDMENEQLLELLLDFGEVENVQIPRDPGQKLNKGYAFILFKRAKDARTFEEFMSGKEFLGRRIRVQLERFQFDSQPKNFKHKQIDTKRTHTNYTESLRSLDTIAQYVEQD